MIENVRPEALNVQRFLYFVLVVHTAQVICVGWTPENTACCFFLTLIFRPETYLFCEVMILVGPDGWGTRLPDRSLECPTCSLFFIFVLAVHTTAQVICVGWTPEKMLRYCLFGKIEIISPTSKYKYVGQARQGTHSTLRRFQAENTSSSLIRKPVSCSSQKTHEQKREHHEDCFRTNVSWRRFRRNSTRSSRHPRLSEETSMYLSALAVQSLLRPSPLG